MFAELRNGVLLSLFACFQDGRQNHTESYIVVDSLFNVPRNICGGSVFTGGHQRNYREIAST